MRQVYTVSAAAIAAAIGISPVNAAGHATATDNITATNTYALSNGLIAECRRPTLGGMTICVLREAGGTVLKFILLAGTVVILKDAIEKALKLGLPSR